jgi:glycerol uptake facilitator-like aquaporin
MSDYNLSRRLAGEFLGTALLLAVVIGSGIMGENLAGGNVAIALLANTLATGAALVVLITVFGPISGAHFNPAVTLTFLLGKEFDKSDFIPYLLAQIAGGILGVLVAHAMFAGIAPSSAPLFIMCQLAGALVGACVLGWMLKEKNK